MQSGSCTLTVAHATGITYRDARGQEVVFIHRTGEQ